MIILMIFHVDFLYADLKGVSTFINTVLKIFSAVNYTFLLIAGYNFEEDSLGSSLKKSFRYCIIPYLVSMVCVLVLFPIIHYSFFKWWPGALSEELKYLLAFAFGIPKSTTVFGIQTYECSVVHFLLSLFIATNLFNLILKIKNNSLKCVSIVLCLLLSKFLYDKSFLFYCIAPGLLSVFYLSIGYLMKKYDLLGESKYKLVIIIISLIGFVYGFINNIYFNLPTGEGSNFFIGNIITLCFSIILLYIGNIMENCNDVVTKTFKTIGLYTPWIMCLHSIEMICFPWYLLMNVNMNKYLVFVIALVLKFIWIYLGCKLIKKIVKIRFKAKMKRRRKA